MLLTIWNLVAASPASPADSKSTADAISRISPLVEEAIRKQKTPGAVVVIGNHGGVLYRKAFGMRETEPHRVSMTEDTVFDLASLTKAVATATAVMQLIEQGKMGLDDPVVKYWPEFGANEKDGITLRHLLTHYSGLRADLNLKPVWSGYQKAIGKLLAERPLAVAGRIYYYSDINFEVLGELVRRVSGMPIDEYTERHIFRPLGMRDTGFKPSRELHSRIAPTQYRGGRLLVGEVHDPSCWMMGGICGHAGLFSTADDLAVFARMLLNKGTLNGVTILSPESVALMTTPQSPPRMPRLRGLGWDIEAPLCESRPDLKSGTYGHLGYTGTSLWVDPACDLFIVVLTNRVHPDGKGDIKDLRAGIKAVFSSPAQPAGPVFSKRSSDR